MTRVEDVNSAAAPVTDDHLVSVVLPTRDRAASLPQAIASVLGQSVAELELIVVDDGSTDDTPHVLARIGDPRLRVLQSPGRGACAARNAGIRAARGTWVAFQDSDDEWHPDKLKMQLAAIAARPDATFCYTDLTFQRGSTTRTMSAPPSPPGGTLLSADGVDFALTAIGTQSLMARRNALERVGLFDERFPRLQDLDLVVRLGLQGPGVRVPHSLVDVDDGAHARISTNFRALAQARILLLAKHGRGQNRRFQAHQRILIGWGFLRAGARLQALRWLAASALWDAPTLLRAVAARQRRRWHPEIPRQT